MKTETFIPLSPVQIRRLMAARVRHEEAQRIVGITATFVCLVLLGTPYLLQNYPASCAVARLWVASWTAHVLACGWSKRCRRRYVRRGGLILREEES